jgi:hypothetical protein
MRLPVLFLLICAYLTSCQTQRKLAETAAALTELKNKFDSEKKQIETIVANTDNKKNEGKMDDIIAGKVLQKTDVYKRKIDSVLAHIDTFNELLEDKRKFRRSYKETIVPGINGLTEKARQYGDRRIHYMMIEDAVNISNYTLFNLAAFFGPGKYKIPDDQVAVAQQAFGPVVDSLIIFSNKYNEIPRTASLVILGFADGTGFSTEGPLYDTLSILLSKSNPSNADLNKKLSELRANEMKIQLTNVFDVKKATILNWEKLRFEYISQGKGEEYPLPTIKDYAVEDERRRIVLCYWVVLPE